MTKRRSSEILVDENRNLFSEKVKSGKFSTELEKYFGNRGNSETRGNASLPQRGGRPCRVSHFKLKLDIKYSLLMINIMLCQSRPGAVHKVRHARGGRGSEKV